MGWYYLAVVVLLVVNVVAWLGNLVMIPGNWLVLGSTLVFLWLVPQPAQRGISGTVLGIAVSLAVLGEVLEFAAGALGAAREGASWRSTLLAVLGTVMGSIAGAGAGIPIPILGPVVGALLGGALGAFAGAYLGEAWRGRPSDASYRAGYGAAVGRLVGTSGKLFLGAVMVVIITLDSIF